MDIATKARLDILEREINHQIDILIKKRDACEGNNKYLYRYVARKLEQALGFVHKAQEKIGG